MAIGRPSYRRGAKKTSDFKIGISNGKPSIQVNWGGRVYGTQLSLIGSGNVKDSLDVSDIRATGNITFSKNSSVYNNSNRILMVGGITVDGDENLAIGNNTVLSSLTNGATSNIGIGTGVGKNITTGDANVCMGIDSGDPVTTGASNVYIGTSTGAGVTDDAISTGNLNVAVGHQAGRVGSSTGAKTVDDLTPTPSGAWQTSQAHLNVASTSTSADGASFTANITTDGSGNPTFIIRSYGNSFAVDEEIVYTDPGNTLSTATLVVASLSGTVSPTYSVFAGYNAGGGMRESYPGSVGIGAYALTQSGSYNVGIGYQAGYSPSVYGAYNILIGYQASVSDIGAENQVAIGKGVTCTANNTTVIGNTDIILDAAGDITLDAAGDRIYFKDAGTSFGVLNTVGDFSSFILYEDGGASTTDYLNIKVGTHGVTTLETIDADASAADFTIDADGDITLDSETGVFIAKKAGTEFSAANSAYAGMILGYTRIQNDGTDVADRVIQVDDSMTVLITEQSTNVSVAFVAPPSGNVEVEYNSFLFASSRTITFALSDDASFQEIDESHTYDAGSVKPDETDSDIITVKWAITGLTPGASLTYYIAAQVSANYAYIYHGRNRTTGVHYPPIIVKATALPATIVTGE